MKTKAFKSITNKERKETLWEEFVMTESIKRTVKERTYVLKDLKHLLARRNSAKS